MKRYLYSLIAISTAAVMTLGGAVFATEVATESSVEVAIDTEKEIAPIAYGSTGNEVKEMQEKLLQLGSLTGTADGSFGPATKNAIAAFQRAYGLELTEEADVETLTVLDYVYDCFLTEAPATEIKEDGEEIEPESIIFRNLEILKDAEGKYYVAPNTVTEITLDYLYRTMTIMAGNNKESEEAPAFDTIKTYEEIENDGSVEVHEIVTDYDTEEVISDTVIDAVPQEEEKVIGNPVVDYEEFWSFRTVTVYEGNDLSLFIEEGTVSDITAREIRKIYTAAYQAYRLSDAVPTEEEAEEIIAERVAGIEEREAAQQEKNNTADVFSDNTSDNTNMDNTKNTNTRRNNTGENNTGNRDNNTETPTQPTTAPSNNNSEPVTQPIITPEPEPATTAHTHSWNPVYKTVHHDAVYNTVHHEGTTKTLYTFMYYPDYSYTYYQCNGCGQNFNTYDEYFAHWESGCDGGYKSLTGYDVDYSNPQYISSYNANENAGAEDWMTLVSTTEEVVSAGYDEQVLVTAAYDEQVVDHYECSGCGAVQ